MKRHIERPRRRDRRVAVTLSLKEIERVRDILMSEIIERTE
jgi:hypothetical protein